MYTIFSYCFLLYLSERVLGVGLGQNKREWKTSHRGGEPTKIKPEKNLYIIYIRKTETGFTLSYNRIAKGKNMDFDPFLDKNMWNLSSFAERLARVRNPLCVCILIQLKLFMARIINGSIAHLVDEVQERPTMSTIIEYNSFP